MQHCVWDTIKAHEKELWDLFSDYTQCGYTIYNTHIFNPANMGYDIVTTLRKGRHVPYSNWSSEGPNILHHVEDHMVWPSDHLKTKLLLIAG